MIDEQGIDLGAPGVTDHGALTGLADDDHAQYAKTDGSRGAFDPAGAAAAAETDANAYTDLRVTKAVIDALGIDAATLEGQTVAQITTAILAAIVDSAPGTLDTLNELAASLGDDSNFAATVTSALAGKQPLGISGTTEKDVCAEGFKQSGTFDITGLAGLTIGAPVSVWQIPGPYTGKGTLTDDPEMDMLVVSAYIVSAAIIRCYWAAVTGAVRGNFKFAYRA